MPVPNSKGGWLLLIFSLPARQASRRVEVWRKLRSLGALALPGSGYLLPRSPQNTERMEWLAAAIRSYKGDASVAQVQAIDNLPHDRLARMFREARTRDYEVIRREVRKLPASGHARARLERLRKRFREIEAMDYFESPLRSRVEAMLTRLEAPPAAPARARVPRAQYRGKKWMTRPRPGIDRVASAWLIRRFIDPQAKFVFDGSDKSAVPFDTFHGGGFGHHGDDCTFETLRREFAVRDSRVAPIAEMVHDADLEDGRFARHEAVGIDRVLVGWAQQGVGDQELLRRGMAMIEGLYQSLPEKQERGKS
jgi:hypothetical protein